MDASNDGRLDQLADHYGLGKRRGRASVALIIALHANADGTSAYPAENRIATITDKGTANVSDCLDDLVAMGVLARTADAVRGGANQRPATYAVLDVAEALRVVAHPTSPTGGPELLANELTSSSGGLDVLPKRRQNQVPDSGPGPLKGPDADQSAFWADPWSVAKRMAAADAKRQPGEDDGTVAPVQGDKEPLGHAAWAAAFAPSFD